MRNIGLGLAFVLEIAAFINFSGLGFLLPTTNILQILASVILLIALIVFWSLYMAPKAPNKLKIMPYYAAKIVIYSLAAFVIFWDGNPLWGTLFIAAAVIDELILFKHNTA